jgi:hypothetical protein
MVQAAEPYVTYEELLAAEQAGTAKNEWLDGVVYAMAGGSLEHSRLAGNMHTALRTAFGGCEVFQSDAMLFGVAIRSSPRTAPLRDRAPWPRLRRGRARAQIHNNSRHFRQHGASCSRGTPAAHPLDMWLDRAAFLAIVSTLSAAACAAPVDDVEQASGAQTVPGGACVAPQVDRGVYPTAEACFSLGESWGQCGAWNRHFYAGVARDAVERAGRGAPAYDAGFEALSATCEGSRADEARLARFCGEIADKQRASRGSARARAPSTGGDAPGCT